LTDPVRLHAALLAATSVRPRPVESYRSAECHMQAHRECTKGQVPPSPKDLPVVYQSCDCWCHEDRRAALARFEEGAR
ncbi:hypothetical protein RM780_27590, partial [Streptomyces sp. DSM 44917]|nr:hypothetical protein [Streptomyces sp. DSM 44917]